MNAMGRLLVVAVVALAVLLVLFIAVMTAYDRIREWVVRRFFRQIVAREQAQQARMDLDMGVCILIDHYLRDGGVSHGEAIAHLSLLHLAPTPEAILQHGALRQWLVETDGQWKATREGIDFANEYVQSFR